MASKKTTKKTTKTTKTTSRKSTGRPEGLKTTKARQLIAEFPAAGSAQLGRMLRERHPKTFKDAEDGRTAVRNARGTVSARHRANQRDKSQQRIAASSAPFPKLPEPWTEFPDWKVRAFDLPGYWGVLQDLHCPFHDKPGLEIAIKRMQDRDPVGIILNGDIIDCHAVGWWQKDPDMRDFQKERVLGQEMLRFIRASFPDAQIIYHEGNHEQRMENYLSSKAPELFGVPELSIPGLLDLDNLGIEYIGDMQPLRIGKLHVLHGHEYRFSISNPVNPARGLFLRGGVSAICGHFHQTSQHSSKLLSQKIISAWSGGCLCDLHPKFLPMNNWNVGFMDVEVDKDGAFNVGNHRIVHGKVYS
jgi:hypothetical protein